MRLTFTTYLDARVDDVAARLDGAVGHGLDEAARRVVAERLATCTEPVAGGLRLCGGLAALDGGELHLHGDEHLTVLEFELPWTPGDSGTTYRAASAFTHTVADSLVAA